ncbi:(Fe-S)-binding protein [Cycloclasticus pugetii]|uniref:(Fe-S)-binding protein n=1 Tax=Cycloclasticus pugetii TaxID=34068 RepID=UPI0039E324D8
MTNQINYTDTDLCVKCGLCLPQCPTYNLTKNENESPRGRLALIQGWSEGHLELTNTLSEHIDNCLTCRACEQMCPAKVPYARLINDFRGDTNTTEHNKLSLLERSFISRLKGQYRKSLNFFLRFYQKVGLSKLPLQLNTYLPAKISSNQFNETYPTLVAERRGHVALFTGCATEVLDSKTLEDTVFLLQHCGFDVSIPPNQHCCGAIDLHAGNHQQALKLAQNNQNTFDNTHYDAVITVASGCGSTLAEYDHALSKKVVDISDFIAPYLSTLSFKPLKASAWLHTPCTLKNAHPSTTDITELLANINELNIRSFKPNQMCCGAAGSYMLTHKETATTLRDQTIAPLKDHTIDYLLTSNVGCALHIRSGLKQAGLNTTTLHPVSLLAQQLKV